MTQWHHLVAFILGASYTSFFLLFSFSAVALVSALLHSSGATGEKDHSVRRESMAVDGGPRLAHVGHPAVTLPRYWSIALPASTQMWRPDVQPLDAVL